MQFNICRLTNVPLLSLSLYSWIHEWRDKTIRVFWFATWAGSSRYPSLVSQETEDPLLIKFVPWRWLYISLVCFTFLWTETWPPWPIPTNVEHCIAFFSYFEKSLKNVHAAIPKGNIRYDQYTVPDTVAVENASLASPLVLQTYVLYMASSLKNSELRTTPNTFQYCCVLFFRPVTRNQGVFTWHRGDFRPGASSLRFPLMALYLFTWYHHKMSCRCESPRRELTPVLVPGREFHSGTKSRNGIM